MKERYVKIATITIAMVSMLSSMIFAIEPNQHKTKPIEAYGPERNIRAFQLGNVNNDSSLELITLEHGTNPLYKELVISVILKEQRKLIWRQKVPKFFVHNLVVGDIDDDKIDEIILYGLRWPSYTDKETTFIVYKWKDMQFTVKCYLLSGKLLKIGDVNHDGKNELILLSHNQSDEIPKLYEWEDYRPSEINIYTCNDSGFFLTNKVSLHTAVFDIEIGDLNNDGLNEIITIESSHRVMEDKYRFAPVKDAINLYQYNRDVKQFMSMSTTNNILNCDLKNINKNGPNLTGIKIITIANQKVLLLMGKRLPNNTNKIGQFSAQTNKVLLIKGPRILTSINVANCEIGDIYNDGQVELIENKVGNLLVYKGLFNTQK